MMCHFDIYIYNEINNILANVFERFLFPSKGTNIGTLGQEIKIMYSIYEYLRMIEGRRW